jgi:16S rRNA (cytosine967-C5)-methyltransferase
VYATCSLLAGENERIVEQFLRDDPRFSTEDAGRLLRSIGLSIDSDPPFLNLRPDLGPTDGYFAAVLRRVAS